jgi:hypothetical protein
VIVGGPGAWPVPRDLGIRSGGGYGQRIRYVRSTVVSGQDRCICVFEASSEALVRRANELAQVPVASIAAAIDYEFGSAEVT